MQRDGREDVLSDLNELRMDATWRQGNRIPLRQRRETAKQQCGMSGGHRCQEQGRY